MAIIEAGLLLALVYVDLAGVPGPARAAHAGEALPQPVHTLSAIGTPRLLPSRLILAHPNTVSSQDIPARVLRHINFSGSSMSHVPACPAASRCRPGCPPRTAAP